MHCSWVGCHWRHELRLVDMFDAADVWCTEQIFYICATMDACKHCRLVNLHTRRYQALHILSFNLSLQLKHLLRHLIYLLDQLIIHWRLFSHAVLKVVDRSGVGR